MADSTFKGLGKVLENQGQVTDSRVGRSLCNVLVIPQKPLFVTLLTTFHYLKYCCAGIVWLMARNKSLATDGLQEEPQSHLGEYHRKALQPIRVVTVTWIGS